MKSLRDRFVGCVLGLALGDAFGAPYEGGVLERSLWWFIGRTRTGERMWTDDTQMSLDLAQSLIANGSLVPDDVAERFASSYRWRRGYGPGAAKILRRIRRGTPWSVASRSVYPDGSYGNGGAMRAPIVGLFYCSSTAGAAEAARASAVITHAHPLGIEGAVLIATAVSKALSSSDALDILDAAAGYCREVHFTERLATARQWLLADHKPEPREVALRLGNGIAAAESCVTALYAGLRFLPASFPELVEFVRKCRGDVDTIAAMGGAVWGAANGAAKLPAEMLVRLEMCAALERVAERLYSASSIYARDH